MKLALYTDELKASDAAALSRAAATSASRQDHDATERFGVGLATSTDVLAAQSNALRARLDLVDAVVDAHLAGARLERALGTPSAP